MLRSSERLHYYCRLQYHLASYYFECYDSPILYELNTSLKETATASHLHCQVLGSLVWRRVEGADGSDSDSNGDSNSDCNKNTV